MKKQSTNLIDILQYAPMGLPLYSPCCGWCKLICVSGNEITIEYKTTSGEAKPFVLNELGRPYDRNGECMLFPNQGVNTWEGWQDVLLPQSTGSVIVDRYGHKYLYANDEFVPEDPNEPFSVVRYHKFDYTNARYATPEETDEFHDHLNVHGFCWSRKHKQIVKRQELQLGDVVRNRETGEIRVLSTYCGQSFNCDCFDLKILEDEYYKWEVVDDANIIATAKAINVACEQYEVELENISSMIAMLKKDAEDIIDIHKCVKLYRKSLNDRCFHGN